MALTILVTPAAGDTIQASIWINEFNNIYNNPISLISPLTATVNLNGQTLSGTATFSGVITFSDTIKASSTIELGHATDTTFARVSAGVASIEGDTILLSTVHNVASAIHGLGASVNVLGNRSASGEYVQRSTYDPPAVSASAISVYSGADLSVTFAVAFGSSPHVWPTGTTTTAQFWSAIHTITTTGFKIATYSGTQSGDPTQGNWVALGG